VETAEFYRGVHIDGVDVSGRTLIETLSFFKEAEREHEENTTVALAFGAKQWIIKASELNYQSNYESVVRAAYNIGRSGSLEHRYEKINQLTVKGVSYSISRGYDIILLRKKIDAIADELNIPVVNTYIESFDLESRLFTFNEPKQGAQVDADKMYSEARRILDSRAGSQTIIIDRKVQYPTVTYETFAGRFARRSQAVTTASGRESRLSNIRLALSSLHGQRIEPGETLSFNGIIGQRTEESGYMLAPAIADGIMRDQVGGGICQVSSTLFLAAAKADLEIVERTNHSRPVAYLDMGKDATVSWPNPDFSFKNNTPYPIFIVAYMSRENRVYVEFYGLLLENGVSIQIESAVLETVAPGSPKYNPDSNLKPGETRMVEKARTGYKTVTYKIYYDRAGNQVDQVELCRSTYPSSGGIINKGP
jgi:vancomycin resistance protein YoaR